MSIDTAASKLRRAYSQMMDDDVPAAIEEKDEVLDEFQPMFQAEAIEDLSEEQFLRFLPFRNNRHWTGLARQGPKMTADMEQLRAGLRILLDEDQDLASRVTEAKEMVDGMGKGTLSAILIVAYPEKYGVWNNTSEAGLKQLDVWPDFERGASFGEKYSKVNRTLNHLSKEAEIDLWSLDSVFDHIVKTADEELPGIEDDVEASTEFVAEKHLQQFMVENWDRVQLSQDWEIYSNSEDPNAGVEYPTGVGPADLLLTHKSEPKVCVVELKKSSSSDRAVGQLLRYLGWVRGNLNDLEGVDGNSTVEGILIVNQETERLKYALSVISDVDLFEYSIDFNLNRPTNEH